MTLLLEPRGSPLSRGLMTFVLKLDVRSEKPENDVDVENFAKFPWNIAIIVEVEPQ